MFNIVKGEISCPTKKEISKYVYNIILYVSGVQKFSLSFNV